MAARWRTWDIDFISSVNFDTLSDSTEIQPVGTERGFSHFKLTSIVLPKEALIGLQNLQSERRGRGRALKNRALSADCPGRRPCVKEKINTLSPLATAFFGSDDLYDELFPDLTQSKATQATAGPQNNAKENKQPSALSFLDIIKTNKQSSQPPPKTERAPSTQTTTRPSNIRKSDNNNWRRTPSPKYWNPINQRTVNKTMGTKNFNNISRSSPTTAQGNSRNTTMSPKPIKPTPMKPNINDSSQKGNKESIFSTIRSYIQNDKDPTKSGIDPMDISTKSETPSESNSNIESNEKSVESESIFKPIKEHGFKFSAENSGSIKESICSYREKSATASDARKGDGYSDIVKIEGHKNTKTFFREEICSFQTLEGKNLPTATDCRNSYTNVVLTEEENPNRKFKVGESDMHLNLVDTSVEQSADTGQNKICGENKSTTIDDSVHRLITVEASGSDRAQVDCQKMSLIKELKRFPIDQENNISQTDIHIGNEVSTIDKSMMNICRQLTEPLSEATIHDGTKLQIRLNTVEPGNRLPQDNTTCCPEPEVKRSNLISTVSPENLTGRQNLCESETDVLIMSSCDSMTALPEDDRVFGLPKQDQAFGFSENENQEQDNSTDPLDCPSRKPTTELSDNGEAPQRAININQTHQGDDTETSPYSATIPSNPALCFPENTNQTQNQVEGTPAHNSSKVLVSAENNQDLPCLENITQTKNQVDGTLNYNSTGSIVSHKNDLGIPTCENSIPDNDQSLKCSQNGTQLEQTDTCQSHPEYEESSSEQTIQHLNHLWSNIEHDMKSCVDGSIVVDNILCVDDVEDGVDDNYTNRFKNTNDESTSNILCGDDRVGTSTDIMLPNENQYDTHEKLDLIKPNITSQSKDTCLEYEVSKIHNVSGILEEHFPKQNDETFPQDIGSLSSQEPQMNNSSNHEVLTPGNLTEDISKSITLTDDKLMSILSSDTHRQETDQNIDSCRCTDSSEKLPRQSIGTVANLDMDKLVDRPEINLSHTSASAAKSLSRETRNNVCKQETSGKLPNHTISQDQVHYETNDPECEPCHVKLENLPPSTMKEDVMEIIEPYGDALSCVFIEQPGSKACIIRMADAVCGEWLVVSLDGLVKDGYRMRTSVLSSYGN